MDPNIHSSTIYNSQGMKTTQVLVPEFQEQGRKDAWVEKRGILDDETILYNSIIVEIWNYVFIKRQKIYGIKHKLWTLAYNYMSKWVH